MKKKLMIFLWNMGIGGVQKRVRDIIVYLSKNHPEIKIYLVIKRAYSTPLLEEIKKIKTVDIRYFSLSKKLIFWPTFFWLVKQYFEIKPDILLTFLDRLSIQAAALKKIIFWHKVKLVLNEGIYTSDYLRLHEFFHPLIKPMVGLFYPQADLIIVPTKAIKKDLAGNFKIPAAKIKVIHHWIWKTNKEIHAKKKYDFIFVGRLSKEKNIHWLIETIKELKTKFPKIKLCILGDGPLKGFLQSTINNQQLTINIDYLGYKNNVSYYLLQSRIILLPSMNEGMPNCILEAGINKLPAIVNNFPGVEEIIFHNKNGFIAKNKMQFQNYSEILLSNNRLKIKMSNYAYKICLEKFSKHNLKQFVLCLLNLV